VGEIAAQLGLRQPQVTKHLQTLERAGLVEVHPLGRRRIYALRREPLRELRDWLGGFAADHPDEDVLVSYQRAIESERARHARRESAARTLRFERELPAPPAVVWRAWTSADVVRRWWSPRHLTVADCAVEPVPGGRLRIVMAEGDGTRHAADGRFVSLEAPRALRFELAPLGPDGTELFTTVGELELAATGARTAQSLTIGVGEAGEDAAPALAGMQIGWEQTLDKLAAEVARIAREDLGERRPDVGQWGS
jgi:uncharacterized protein YndB with AHSA1/START domain